MNQAAQTSRCESETVEATNSCLCRNGGDFVTLAAECIGRESRGDLKETYDIMKEACDISKTPITITEDEFMDAANPATTSSSASSTATPSNTDSNTAAPATTTPADDGNDKQGGSTGLTTGALAGIIAGGVVGLILVGILAFFLFRRRKSSGEESYPMLPQQQAHLSSAYYGSPPPDKAGWPVSADARSSGFNWESPAHLSYAGGQDQPGAYPLTGAYKPVAELAPSPTVIQELDGVVHHPTGSAAAPAEMAAASPVAATAAPATQFQPFQPYPGQLHAGSAWNPSQR